MASSGFDPAPTWQVDALAKRVDALEKERWEESDRRFRLWIRCYLALCVLGADAIVVFAIVHAAAR